MHENIITAIVNLITAVISLITAIIAYKLTRHR